MFKVEQLHMEHHSNNPVYVSMERWAVDGWNCSEHLQLVKYAQCTKRSEILASVCSIKKRTYVCKYQYSMEKEWYTQDHNHPNDIIHTIFASNTVVGEQLQFISFFAGWTYKSSSVFRTCVVWRQVFAAMSILAMCKFDVVTFPVTRIVWQVHKCSWFTISSRGARSACYIVVVSRSVDPRIFVVFVVIRTIARNTGNDQFG